MQRNLSIRHGGSPGTKLRTHGVERKLTCHRIGGHRNRYRRFSAWWYRNTNSQWTAVTGAAAASLPDQ
eukprot:2908159-Pleurochrysis_carterae.AAC.1